MRSPGKPQSPFPRPPRFIHFTPNGETIASVFPMTEPVPASARIFQFPAVLGLCAGFMFLVFIAFWLLNMDRTITLVMGAIALLDAAAWGLFTLIGRNSSDSNDSLGA